MTRFKYFKGITNIENKMTFAERNIFTHPEPKGEIEYEDVWRGFRELGKLWDEKVYRENIFSTDHFKNIRLKTIDVVTQLHSLKKDGKIEIVDELPLPKKIEEYNKSSLIKVYLTLKELYFPTATGLELQLQKI